MATDPMQLLGLLGIGGSPSPDPSAQGDSSQPIDSAGLGTSGTAGGSPPNVLDAVTLARLQAGLPLQPSSAPIPGVSPLPVTVPTAGPQGPAAPSAPPAN